MTDNNDFLEWLDEQPDAPDTNADGWTCDSMAKAEASARRLRRASDKLAEINAVADRLIADANAWREHVSAPHDSAADIERRNLETFLRIQIEQGGAKSCPLPHNVSVSARQVGGTLEFVKDFADTAPDDVVRVKRSIDAKAAKEYYRVVDGVVVDPNGEIVEGVTVRPVTDNVKVVA